MKSIRLLTTLLAFLPALALWSQAALQGKIIGSDGTPLVGATVQVKGTGTGAVADANGVFNLELPPGDQLLLVSYAGYGSREVRITAGMRSVEITLEEGVTLRETVVTALGISREKKSLGYAVQEVRGDDLTRAPSDANILSNLQGKLAGVQITSASGQVGASARMVIRGSGSIFGNNQPLFVVNGVPTDNSSFSAEAKYGGTDYGNAISDISPDDVESITVLKGPAASALYGSRAVNGVVLITTKSGKNAAKKGIGVSYTGNFGFSTPLSFWNIQDAYGQGNGQQFKYVDGTGTGQGALYDGTDESWGPAFDVHINETDGVDNDGNGQVDEAGEGTYIDQHTGQHQPWRPHPNSFLKTMDTGLDISNQIAVTATGERMYSRFSYTNFYQKGMIPTTELSRNSVNLAFGAALTKKLSTDGTISYVRTDSENRAPVGYFGNVTFQTTWSGRQVDWLDLKEKWNTTDELGRPYNWNHNYYNNPFWELHNNKKPMNRDRVNGYYAVNYAPVEWLNVKGRVSNDFYREFRRQINVPVAKWNYLGAFTDDGYTVNELNTDLLITAKPKLNEAFSLQVTAGANHLLRRFEVSSLAVDGLTVPGIYNPGNAANSTKVTQFQSRKIINSMYASASIGYRSWLFLDLTGRNDWSSTLPNNANSYFYPSVGLGLILSDLLQLGKQVDYLKLRGGWARVGSDTDPYQLKFTYANNPAWKNLQPFTVPDQLPNNQLKPEIKTSYEVGLEVFAFKKRLGLDLSYYRSNAQNQILPVDVSGAAGFSSRITNAGTILNEGLELQMSGTPLRTGSFSWDVQLNWSTNHSEVTELPPGVTEIVVGDNGGCLLVARIGEAYGQLRGTQLLRNPEGQLILQDGLPLVDPIGNVSLGSVFPKWFGGLRNVFTWKNFSLSTLIDARFGSKFLSWGYLSARYAGVLEETLEGRRTADEVKNGYAFEGVIDNGDGTYRPNDVKVSAESWNKHFPWYIGGDFKRGVLDGSFVKLREVTLSYALPESWYGKLKLQALSVSVYARNLFWLYRGQDHYDPDYQYTTRNDDQGQEVNQPPALRTIGFQINAAF